jgi:hypothetical protein
MYLDEISKMEEDLMPIFFDDGQHEEHWDFA